MGAEASMTPVAVPDLLKVMEPAGRCRSSPNYPSSFEDRGAVVASVQRVGPLMEHTVWFDSRGSNDRQVPTG